MATKQQIEGEIVRILRALKVSDGDRRTMLYRDLAGQMVELREHYLTPGGDPDWVGRTGAYRLGVRDLYTDAGYNLAERKAVQTSIRYHVGNEIRDRVPAEDLKALGLDSRAPKTRARDSRREELIVLKEHRDRKKAEEEAARKKRRG